MQVRAARANTSEPEQLMSKVSVLGRYPFCMFLGTVSLGVSSGYFSGSSNLVVWIGGLVVIGPGWFPIYPLQEQEAPIPKPPIQATNWTEAAFKVATGMHSSQRSGDGSLVAA